MTVWHHICAEMADPPRFFWRLFRFVMWSIAFAAIIGGIRAVTEVLMIESVLLTVLGVGTLIGAFVYYLILKLRK